jgi:hypothetical protein
VNGKEKELIFHAKYIDLTRGEEKESNGKKEKSGRRETKKRRMRREDDKEK